MRTGAVNNHLDEAALPKAPQGNAPTAQTNPRIHHRSNSQPVKGASVEIVPEKLGRKHLTGKFDGLSNSVDQASIRRLIISALIFFVLFFIIAVTKIYSDNQRFKQAETSTFQTDIASRAHFVDHRIGGNVAWMDTALSVKGSPQQIIDVLARGKSIAGAALIDSAGQVIAATPEAGPILSQIDRRNFPKSGILISSIINKDGRINPVITRRSADVFLVMAKTPGSLLDSTAPNMAIIADNGLVIDGPQTLGLEGTGKYYGLSARQLNTLTASSSLSTISRHNMNDSKVWLGSGRVPNSFLTIIDTVPRTLPTDLKYTMMLFALLFAGTAWLVWVLLRNMYQQISVVKEKQALSEVSQQRYRAAIDGSRGGVWEIDLASNQAYISQSLAGILGLPMKEMILSMPQFLELFTATDRDKLLSYVRRAHVNGQFEIDMNAAHLPITLACQGRPSVRGTDQAKVVIGMALDMTETRGAQARLQAAEARLFDALRSMNDSFVIWDQLDRLVLWNTKFEDFFGFAPGALQAGIDYATIQHHASFVIENTYALNDGTGQEVELKDGRWVRYLETHTADGGRVSIGTEVTAIRTRESQLQTNQAALQKTITVLKKSQVRIVELAENYEQEKIRAEEANQSKSEFLANMSHELRTPLNAINGFSDIMKKELFGPLGDPRYKEYVNDILFSGQHLLSLINDILDMSKIEAGKMTLNTEELQMNEMVGQIIRIVRGRAEENRLKLIYDETSLPEIEADPRAVKQILLNLTTNAIKFTPEGGVVTISVEPKSAGLIIRVSDTGIGISEEDIKRLAQPFEQIDSQHSRKHEGTGLGLALSKSLVELHGGNFTIESTIGQGTTVIFTLPNKPPEAKIISGASEVGNEISRLAKDIAEVLTEGELETAPQQAPQAAMSPNGMAGEPPVASPPPHPVEFVPHGEMQPAQPPVQNQTINPANPAA